MKDLTEDDRRHDPRMVGDVPIEVFERLVAERLGAHVLARICGCSRWMVYKRARVLGLALASWSPSPFARADWAGQVAEMRPMEAVRYLLEELGRLSPPAELLTEVCVRGVRVHGIKLLVFRMLWASRGNWVARDLIFARCYGDRADGDQPSNSALEVHISQVRTLFRRHDLAIRLEGHWGYARWRVVCEDPDLIAEIDAALTERTV